MIAKVPARRNDGKSSFGLLGRYIAGEKIDLDTGEIIRDSGDVVAVSNCLAINTAPAEMRAVADMNGRVKDPVYHCILSWRPGENPSNSQMIDAAHLAQAALGMAGHQYVYAIHRDVDHAHIHLMVNRVQAETYKAIYPSRDFYTLDRCMREIELTQGWAHDNGPYQVCDGQVTRAKRDVERPPSLPTKARDKEAATGCESLLTYAQQVAPEVIKTLEAGDWQDLHAALRRHGLEIREAGQGFKIHDLANPITPPIKASDMAGELGGGKLRARLGQFKRAMRVVQTEQPTRVYNPYREKSRTTREDRREARAAARLALRQRYDTLRADARAIASTRREAERLALRELSKGARTERDAIRKASLSQEEMRARLSLLAMATIQERARLKAEAREQREAARIEGYRAWCAEQAAAGDEAAIAQLKGYEYQDSRRRKAARKAEDAAAEGGAVRAATHEYDTPTKPLPGMDWAVDRMGNVTYRIDGRDALLDRGSQVDVLQPLDDAAIKVALQLAAQKYGPVLTLTGPADFRARAVQIAAEKLPGLRFAEPEAERYRLALLEQRQALQRKEKNNGSESRDSRLPSQSAEQTRPGANPRGPVTANKVQPLSVLDVVRGQGDADSALRDSPPRNLER